MANDVKIRFRSFLPGVGFDSAGNAKQGKTRVVGTVTVTSYGGGEGELLPARDLGLTAIDSINLRPENQNSGAFSAAAGGGRAPYRMATYTKSSGHFYVFSVDADGQHSGHAAGATESLEFDATGDSAHDVELV